MKLNLKIHELKTLSAKERAFSIELSKDETIEIVKLKNNKVNLIVKKE